MDKYEFRGSRYGGFNAFYADTNRPGGIVTDDLRMKFEGNANHSTIQTPVFNYDGSISLGAARAITVSDSENTTTFQTISKTAVVWGFKIYPAAFQNNEVKVQEDFEKKYWKYWNLVYSTLDSLALAHLNTYKSQVFADTLVYSEASNVINASLAQELRVMGDIGVMLEANDFFDGTTIVGNGGTQSLISRLAQRGLYNEENNQLQYADKVLHFTNRLSNADGKIATMYAINDGSLGFLTGVDREALLRTRSKDKGREWDVITDPLYGFKVGSMYYEEDGDYNAIAGAATADFTSGHAECYQFSFDYGFLSSYNSAIATRAQPILKLDISAS